MAFKMKGSPMHRNYGIGSPMKDGKPGATSELLRGLEAYGTGSDLDPTVVKNNKAEALRGVDVPDDYDNMSEDERNRYKKSIQPEIDRKNALADRVVNREVTPADIESQAKARARANNRAAKDKNKG